MKNQETENLLSLARRFLAWRSETERFFVKREYLNVRFSDRWTTEPGLEACFSGISSWIYLLYDYALGEKTCTACLGHGFGIEECFSDALTYMEDLTGTKSREEFEMWLEGRGF